MQFKNTSIFFVPISFDDYGTFTAFYRNRQDWRERAPEENETQYLLEYAHCLSIDTSRYTCFQFTRLPAPVFMHNDEFDPHPNISEIRLSCFSTGIAFLEVWIEYKNMTMEQIANFSYRFKKAKVSKSKTIPEGTQSLYDFALSVLPQENASLFFPYYAPFKCECSAFHFIKTDCCDEELLSKSLALLKRSYNTSFTGCDQQSDDYDMTYIPYAYDRWAGSQEGLVNIVTGSDDPKTRFYIENLKYDHLIRDDRFLYLLLLNQRFSAIKYISMISTAHYNQIDHSELQEKLILLKTSFSFRILSDDMIFQNIYSKMYRIYKIDELMADISENEELVEFQRAQKANEAEKKANRLLYGISLLSIFSALIDAASYFERFPFPYQPGTATFLSTVCVVLGIVFFLITGKRKR